MSGFRQKPGDELIYLLYSVLYGGWILLLLPYFLYQAWRYNKYLPSLRERLGMLPDRLKSDGRMTVWCHSCSVGETLSLQPIVDGLRQKLPEARFVFSTITNSGQAIAKRRFERYGPGNTFFFPLDLPFVANKVLDAIQPSILVIVDTEIWPNVLRQTRERGIPIVMINGRVSARSFRFYRWAAPVFGSVFENYRFLLMKSDEDAERILKMGADPKRVVVSGNIKFDKELVEKQISEELARDLDRCFGISDHPAPLIVAGSTHEGEEEVLLEVYHRLRAKPGSETLRLMLAPRHPERFDKVARLIEDKGLFPQRRSQSLPGESLDSIMLLDSLGELATAFRFATVAFVGGTLISHGGQSILEPAAHAKPIVIGPSMENFPQIIDSFLERGAVIQLKTSPDDTFGQIQQLTAAFLDLLQNEVKRRRLGEAARSVFEGNVGAARLTVERLSAFLEEGLHEGSSNPNR